MMKIIRAFSGRGARLRFETHLWREMLAELGKRGRGSRESGAFLLTPIKDDGRTVSHIVYLDDLDPHCLTGSIHFRREGYAKLAALCKSRYERVAGDVHTHPGDWVGQSPTDQANPMVSRAGHVALIVPRFSQSESAVPDIGCHLYDGVGWRAYFQSAARRMIYVGRWP